MNEDIEPLSKIIADAREAMGLNQSELARRVSVTPQAVQKWEAGTSAPRIGKMVDVALALGIDDSKIARSYGLWRMEQRSAERREAWAAQKSDTDNLPAGLSAEEKKLLRLFRAIPEDLRETAIAQIKPLSDLTSKKVNEAPAENGGKIISRPSQGDERQQSAQEQGVEAPGSEPFGDGRTSLGEEAGNAQRRLKDAAKGKKAGQRH